MVTFSATEKLAINIKISVEFKQNWGSKRLDSVNWDLKFVFEGENMDVYGMKDFFDLFSCVICLIAAGSPSQFIKSVNVNVPQPKYDEEYGRVHKSINNEVPTTLNTLKNAPWYDFVSSSLAFVCLSS